MPHVDIDQRRKAKAEEVFESLITTRSSDIEDFNGWDVEGDTWQRTIFWKNEDANEPSVRGSCVIEFKADAVEVLHENLHEG